jgi:protein-L-isoaspartate(D-aspartate) O-methyltransferase
MFKKAAKSLSAHLRSTLQSNLCKGSVALLISSAFLTGIWCNAGKASAQDFKKLRERMVSRQIEERGVTNQKVLTVLRTVERHKFVPPEYRSQAYDDCPLPIGQGQTISQPYIVALMTEMLDPDSTKKILEIGTGSGYQAAVLAMLCDTVYTIEINKVLGSRAAKLLAELGYTNITVKTGDGYKGWQEHAPFDGIIVTCAPTHVPQPLKEQLKEGGRMVIPVGEAGAQELFLFVKANGELRQKEVVPVLFVPMIDKKGKMY